MTEGALLSVRGLNAWYDESHVLSGVDLDIGEGEVVSLLGRNGVGKTTTLRAIMGLMRRREGHVRFRGQELIGLRPNRIARAGLAYCPEERGIFASLNVIENLNLPPRIAPGGLDAETIFGLFPNLRERISSPGTKLSGGEQQMLAIARILRTGARFLMLDEPTEGLAPVIVQQIGRTLRELKARGFTILLVEQNLRFARGVTDRHYVMEHGRTVDQIAAADFDAGLPRLKRYLGVTMLTLFGFPIQLILGQLLIGAINGAFYALLSMGLAIIFGLLNIINFAHGAFFMVGAFAAWMMLDLAGIGYWWALLLSPLIVGALALVLERLVIRRLYALDHVYGLLLTFGLTLMIEAVFRNAYGTTGLSYPVPALLDGGIDLGFLYLPVYRAWVIGAALVICFGTWFAIERTPLGATLRAATENAALVEAFGINVPRLIMFTYAGGVALAALGGVLAAPIYSVSPNMGSNLVVIVFAVVVIGGMGSILGAIVTGFLLGLIEGLTKVIYPEASSIIVFIVMILVLVTRPAGLFGRAT